jgi:hypothetical protein
LAQYPLPPVQVDLASLPPPILTSEPGSFARHTIAVRVPRIIEDTITQNHFSAEIVGSLAALRDEILSGVAQPLGYDAPDREFWQQASAQYLGRSWLDVPWYWAEAYFYRRVLEATGYFRPGPGQGFDPFATAKESEWAPRAAPAAVAALLAAAPDEPQLRFARLLQASLWGNRIDLSLKHVADRYSSAEHMGGQAADEEGGLLVDDTPAVWNLLGSGRGHPRLISFIADNAGTELSTDLVLIDHLLSAGLAAQVVLHLKPQPFFVSDATFADVDAGLAALSAGAEPAAALAGRMRDYLSTGRVQLRTHWFYPTSLFYFQLPEDLHVELARSALVIVKGDANYRRLLGDAHWPWSESFQAATSYFPAPLVALRTLKSELVTGLPEGLGEELAQQDPDWLTNGSRGVVQSRL